MDIKILSWNIQWGWGIEGRVDLERVAREVAREVARGGGVIRLQEVAVNYPSLPGGASGDQVVRLAELLPG